MSDDDFEILAASLRADDTDLSTFVEVLAVKLESALPQRTRVVRKRKGMLTLDKQVHRIEVDVHDEKYSVAYDGRSLDTRVAKVVRGITLKTDEVPLEIWTDALARAISAEARDSEQGRRALERLLGVGG
jgi:hypothetical protein